MNISYDPDSDYYQVLGVDPDTDAETIQRAYRARAKAVHPDVNQDVQATERFQLLNEAYNVLSDPASRGIYNNLRWLFNNTRAEHRPQYRPSYQYQPPATTLADLMKSAYRYPILVMAAVMILTAIVVVTSMLVMADDTPPPVSTSTLISSAPNAIIESESIPSLTPAPSVTPESCSGAISIFNPEPGLSIASDDPPVPLVGTLSNTSLVAYQVEVIDQENAIHTDILHKTVDAHPVEEILAWIDLSDMSPGSYEIRITSLDNSNRPLGTCSVIVQRL